MRTWVELNCRIPAPLYAELEAVLERVGALAITRSDGDLQVFAEPGVTNDHAWGSFTVEALFDADADLDPIMSAIRATIGDAATLASKVIADQAWAEAWKERWHPLQFAHGLCVCPTWCTPPVGATQVIFVDPGQAFGTGTHETTALCLDWLSGHAGLTGRRVIDYGCGSGILALAAARLGAASVLAVDVDDDALAVARDNVRRNACEQSIRIGGPELVAGVEADVVIANILLQPLLALAPRFAALLPPAGQLVLAGILIHQVPRALEVYGERFTMAAPRHRGDWALLSGQRR